MAEDDEALVAAMTAFRLGDEDDPAFDAGCKIFGRACIRAEHWVQAHIEAGKRAKK